MKNFPLKCALLLILCCYHFESVASADTTKISISLNYSKDLSDTYGGGDLFSGESTFSRSWYGIKGSFGHFNSQSYFVLEVPYSEIGKILEINIPEMSFMKIGTISFFLRPVDKKWITTDFVFGASISKAKSFFNKTIEYEYSIEEDRFTYVQTDYHLVRTNHFGYHAGIDITFFLSKKIGLQVNSRIHDLSNGGSFFFVGTGLCFRL